jgi:PEP-CTERM motif-containing protein
LNSVGSTKITAIFCTLPDPAAGKCLQCIEYPATAIGNHVALLQASDPAAKFRSFLKRNTVTKSVSIWRTFIMSQNRPLSSFVLALIVALSFTTLAAANTVNINGSAFHAPASAPSYFGTHSTNFASLNAAAAPAISKVEIGNANFGGVRSTISYRAKNWNGGNQKAPMSTPEPGSLMLLSTGLVGIAGMVRRKLLSPLTVSA